MGNLQDTLEILIPEHEEDDRKSHLYNKRDFTKQIYDCIEIKSMSFMRGRSFQINL